MKHRTAHSQGNRRTLVAVLAGTAVFASAHRAGAAFNAKLNDPLVAGGDVMQYHFAISPDSARVVYRADQDSDGVDELYSVPIAGGTVVKLNDPLVTGGQVTYFAISPDSSRVVYHAEQETVGVQELYSVPIGGGTVVRLNGELVSFGDVWTFTISSHSSRVVYQADQDTDEVVEVYSVPITGGTATRLNGPLVSGGSVRRFSVSPDGSRVVYSADQDEINTVEIYSVPIAGGTVVKLNDELPFEGLTTSDSAISADSARVVYQAMQDALGVWELYSVPIAGGTVVKLNNALAPGGDVDMFAISADGSRVVYRADQDTDGKRELYSVPTVGGTPVKVNGALTAGGNVTMSFATSADSARVVYQADQDVNDQWDLYSAPIAGGATVKLNAAMVTGGSIQSWTTSADSSRVVYRADQHTFGMYEIYSVPIAGGTATKLNHSLSPGGTTSSPAVSADSRRVVYQGRQDSVWAWKLHSVPLTGGTVAKLNGRMQPDGDVRSFMISADSARVVYVADQDTDGDDEIYSSAMYRSDLSVGKTVDNEDPKEGDSVVFTIRCWNNGPDDLTGCEVTDLLPAGVTYQSHSTAGTYTPGSGVWDVGPLTASGLGALTIWATVDSGTMGETITNTATVTASDLPDPDTGNDSDSAAVTVGAGVHYVTPHGDHVTPFINWDNAATTIQAAVDVALDGATVWVSNGVYSVGGKALDEFSVTNRVCIENNILVQSVTGPDDTHIVGAADPATTNGPAAARCVYIAGTAGLSGFTLRDGHTHDGDGEEYYGGGVYFAGGGTLSNCVIRNCGSYEIGGGAYMQSGGELIDCLIVSNRSMFGGGVYLSGGSAAHCRILDNVADDAGGGAHMDDGELFTCLLAGNTAGTDGGGVSLSYDGSITFCTVAGNHAGGNGGGFYGYGGGYLWTTILYGNTAEGSGTNWYDEFADASHEYCCTTPEPVGESNVVANPMFVNAGVGNYRLQGSSPCIDAGGEEGFLGPDLDGVPRAQDGDGDGTDTVDIGCYEYVMDADLAVFKSDVSDPVIAGRMLTYTILVTNTGPGEAASVVVADSLPASVTFDAAGSPGWGETGGIATYTVGTLGNGAGTGLTLRVHVPASHIGNLSNEVGVTSMTPDQATENNAAFALTEVIAQSDLALEKTDWPDPVVSSNTIVYTIAVTNSGPSYAWDVAVTDSLPEGVTFDAGASPGWSATNGVYVYSVGTLPDGGMTSLTLRVTVADTTTGTITNEAGTGTSATDTNLTDNAALEDTTIADLDGDGDPDFHDPDDDGDTMWDTWEDDHGLNPTNAADATGNPDHDPHINREEFVADTNPTDSNDYLRITAISNNSPVTVYFKSSSDRLYTVIGCSNLAEGIWTNVPGAGPEQGAGGADSLQDTNLPARGPFYRLEAELPE